jgi:hypothetical protein
VSVITRESIERDCDPGSPADRERGACSNEVDDLGRVRGGSIVTVVMKSASVVIVAPCGVPIL